MKKVLTILLILLVIALLVFGGIYLYINSKLDKINYDENTMNNEAVEEKKTGYRTIALFGNDSLYDG